MPISSLSLRHWSLVIGVALTAVVTVRAQRSAFRSSVDLITLTVTVTAPGGRQVSDLSAEDFEIFENGLAQELAFFSRAETSLSVSVLLDSSASMEERMALAQKAATKFVGQLRSGDIAEIVNFDSRVEVLQPFTDARSLLEVAIQRLRAGGATALYNALYIALRQLEKGRPRVQDEIRREVIVVLSDGEDTSSLVTFDEVMDLAKRSQAAIYTIGLGLEEQPLRFTRANGLFALRRLAQETGGRLFVPKRPEDLFNVYSQIADELTGQYILGYLSRDPRQDGGWRSIAVQVRRATLQARTRTGYYAIAQ